MHNSVYKENKGKHRKFTFPFENKPHKGSLKVLLHTYNFKRWTKTELGNLAPPVYSTILNQQFKLPRAL